MEIRLSAFNINLWLLAALLSLSAGCQTAGDKQAKKKDKEATVLRLHLEVNPDGTDRNHPVPVFRAQPVMVNVNREWFLNEGDVLEAAVVDTIGGFALRLQFNKHGTLVLDTLTTSYRGRRVAIFSQFGQNRWLAAPLIQRRITDGVLTFTPDATREETERIARGLNNISKELNKKRLL